VWETLNKKRNKWIQEVILSHQEKEKAKNQTIPTKQPVQQTWINKALRGLEVQVHCQ